MRPEETRAPGLGKSYPPLSERSERFGVAPGMIVQTGGESPNPGP